MQGLYFSILLSALFPTVPIGSSKELLRIVQEALLILRMVTFFTTASSQKESKMQSTKKKKMKQKLEPDKRPD